MQGSKWTGKVPVWFSPPSLPLSPFLALLLSLPLEVVPLKSTCGPGEHCKLP